MLPYGHSIRGQRAPFPCDLVHVLDVADAHVKSLELVTDLKVSSFLLSGPSFDWPQVADFVKDNYPQIDVKVMDTKARFSPMTTRAFGNEMENDGRYHQRCDRSTA
jgi:hypothetical protein